MKNVARTVFVRRFSPRAFVRDSNKPAQSAVTRSAHDVGHALDLAHGPRRLFPRALPRSPRRARCSALRRSKRVGATNGLSSAPCLCRGRLHRKQRDAGALGRVRVTHTHREVVHDGEASLLRRARRASCKRASSASFHCVTTRRDAAAPRPSRTCPRGVRRQPVRAEAAAAAHGPRTNRAADVERGLALDDRKRPRTRRSCRSVGEPCVRTEQRARAAVVPNVARRFASRSTCHARFTSDETTAASRANEFEPATSDGAFSIAVAARAASSSCRRRGRRPTPQERVEVVVVRRAVVGVRRQTRRRGRANATAA